MSEIKRLFASHHDGTKSANIVPPICLFVALVAFSPGTLRADIVDASQTLQLSKSEATTLKLIANRESVLREMASASIGLEAINTVAGLVIQGPAKLAVQWNKSAIEGFKFSIDAMGRIAEARTCNDISLEIVSAPAASQNYIFWSNLSEALGC